MNSEKMSKEIMEAVVVELKSGLSRSTQRKVVKITVSDATSLGGYFVRLEGRPGVACKHDTYSTCRELLLNATTRVRVSLGRDIYERYFDSKDRDDNGVSIGACVLVGA